MNCVSEEEEEEIIACMTEKESTLRFLKIIWRDECAEKLCAVTIAG